MRLPNDDLYNELAANCDRLTAAGIAHDPHRRLPGALDDCRRGICGHRYAREADAAPVEGVPSMGVGCII
jgi:hypothetical protein